MNQQKISEAVATVENALKIEPRNIGCLFLKAFLAVKEDKKDEAIKIY